MGSIFYTLKISQDVENLIKMARAEFLHHHPEFEGIKLSKNKILLEALKFYLES